MSIFSRISRWVGASDTMSTVSKGRLAPNFALNSPDGKEYSLANAMTKGPVVLAFFKISCPTCQFTFPFLERLYQRFGKAATFLGVSQDNAEKTRDFLQHYGVTFPVVLDPVDSGYLVSNAYGLTNVPTFYLIESDGSVTVSSVGFGKKEIEDIAATLSEKQQIAAVPFFRADETVPAHKPG